MADTRKTQASTFFCWKIDLGLQRGGLSKDFISTVIVDFCVHNPPGGQSVKIVNNGVVSPYPSSSVVYNAVVSGLVVAECNLWEWTWFAKNCAQAKRGLKVRAELSY